MKNELSFPQMMLGQLDIHLKKNELGLLLNMICKNELKMSDKLKERAKTTRVLEENLAVNLHDLGLGKDIL